MINGKNLTKRFVSLCFIVLEINLSTNITIFTISAGLRTGQPRLILGTKEEETV